MIKKFKWKIISLSLALMSNYALAGSGSLDSTGVLGVSIANKNCITTACSQVNTGGSVTIGSCNPANPAQDDAPVVNHFECSWNGTGWTFGSNINAACGNGSCSPTYLEWADQTTTRKCDGTIRTQNNDFSRCVNSGGETCALTWSDGSVSYIPGDQAAADAGTNYITAYAATSVPWGSTCTSQRRYCQETSPGSGIPQITGSFTAKNCTIQPPANCTAPWGAGVAHGTSITAYQSASVNAPATCNSESRGCINGNLSGSYTNQSCVVVTNGSCGSANGTHLASAPSGAALCSTGSAGAVSGGASGPWSWSCNGINGGTTASCATN